MKTTKIDWCNCTVNPVIGCPNGCRYCYGEVMNNRFHYIPNWREPQYRPEQLKQFDSKKPKSVFIDSMSDIGCWSPYWLYCTLDAIIRNPQHKYIALTKTNTDILTSKIMHYMRTYVKANYNPIILGKSVTTQLTANALQKVANPLDFLSVEPLLERINFERVRLPKTIIIGAETGNDKNKVIPHKEWIRDIMRCADKQKCVVFMKESLRTIMGDEFRQDKLPWAIEG